MKSTILGLLLLMGFSSHAQFNQKLAVKMNGSPRSSLLLNNENHLTAYFNLTQVRSAAKQQASSPRQDRKSYDFYSSGTILNYHKNHKPTPDLSGFLLMGYQIFSNGQTMGTNRPH